MGVETMWAISTGHITQEAAEALQQMCDPVHMTLGTAPLIVYPHGEYGWLINVVALGGCGSSWVVDNHPSLDAVIMAAIELSMCWVLLDRDADIVHHLPVYDW